MKEWIKKHQVSEIECIVPDLSGAARGKIMPASKYTGGHATFMAKPIANQPGNSMHIHQSMVSLDKGKNLFSTTTGTPMGKTILITQSLNRRNQ
jgi:glutamine synthetase